MLPLPPARSFDRPTCLDHLAANNEENACFRAEARRRKIRGGGTRMDRHRHQAV
jgi:hypothetical protein